MSIKPASWRLDGADSTLLVVHDNTVPRLYWIGQRLQSDFNVAALLAHDDTALAFGMLDATAPLTLFPDASTGYMGSPALNGHRQSQDFAHRFALQNVEQSANKLSFELTDPASQLTAHIHLQLHPDSDVASIETCLTNKGSEPYTVDWLASATLPLPAHFSHCQSQFGRWGLENQVAHHTIGHGRIDISNLHGRTSHEHTPGLICGSKNFAEDDGDVLFAHLAWSGNFSLRVERLSDGTGYLKHFTLIMTSILYAT